MAHTARAEPNAGRFTRERYYRLVTEGVLSPDDRVELLEGVVVAMAPQGPRHEVAGDIVAEALRRAVGAQAAVRVQRSLVAGRRSVPEPDVAVVPGRLHDYVRSRPTTALLVVEVADASLPQDRITKAAIYAGAGIPEYWIVNLRDDQVEVFRAPDLRRRLYRDRRIARPGERLGIASLEGASVAVEELLPDR
ncbi:MAG: Uma2 family endonuclease [Deltaproteobacteria bacterium]|nr:MAG: Uma2 family endonuclease [Deltaproteobacteria bacterium]TMA65121.1 MAG: Uma2 family endonuclease [Deltaproteobacteria bacterium]